MAASWDWTDTAASVELDEPTHTIHNNLHIFAGSFTREAKHTFCDYAAKIQGLGQENKSGRPNALS
jgi:hypothetical protein